MKQQKFFSVVLGLGLVFTSIGMVNAADLIEADESFAMPNDAAPGQHGVIFTDQDTGQIASHLTDSAKFSNDQIDPSCVSLDDKTCTSNQLDFQAIIPFCQSAADINCLEEVGAVKEDGTKVVGEFKQYFPLKAQNEFVGNPDYQLPSGTSGSIFTFPNLSHKGGDLYFASFQINGFLQKSNKKSTMNAFSARITPVQIQSAPLTTQTCGETSTCPDAGYAYNVITKKWGSQASGFDGIHSCAATSAKDSMCAQRFSFPENLRVYLKVRLNLAPSGWLHGRFADPTVDISTAGQITKISVEALPVRVPIVYKSYFWKDLPGAVKSAYNEQTGDFSLGSSGSFTRVPGSWGETDPSKRHRISAPSPSGSTGIEELKTWLPIVDDRATAMPSMWSVRSLRNEEMSGSNKCFESSTQLTGLVSTNATQYSAGPPRFDQADGTLVYQVAAPHFTTAGDVFRGRYDLTMRSDIARCVYGFSKAPIKAELSIVSADGSPQIATTVLGEKNGWVFLSAANFEFSAPIIKAKLSQEVVVEPTPTPTPTPTATATPTPTKKPVVAKKTTITCVKGKTSKKVTAIKPKCPTGFKVKK
jgi:hypothetical protein